MWEESAPPAAMVWVGTTDLRMRNAQLHHPLGGEVVHWFGISLGEVAGMGCRIMPHGPGGRRGTNHCGPTEQPLRRSLELLPFIPDAHASWDSRNCSDRQGPIVCGLHPPRVMVSDFVLGSYVLSSKPKTKSDTAQCGSPQGDAFVLREYLRAAHRASCGARTGQGMGAGHGGRP